MRVEGVAKVRERKEEDRRRRQMRAGRPAKEGQGG